MFEVRRPEVSCSSLLHTQFSLVSGSRKHADQEIGGDSLRVAISNGRHPSPRCPCSFCNLCVGKFSLADDLCNCTGKFGPKLHFARLGRRQTQRSSKVIRCFGTDGSVSTCLPHLAPPPIFDAPSRSHAAAFSETSSETHEKLESHPKCAGNRKR